MKIGKQYCHLVVNRQQPFLALFQLVLQRSAVGARDVRRHRAATDVDADWIQPMHRFTEVLVAELDLNGALRLQDATPRLTQQITEIDSLLILFCHAQLRQSTT